MLFPSLRVLSPFLGPPPAAWVSVNVSQPPATSIPQPRTLWRRQIRMRAWRAVPGLSVHLETPGRSRCALLPLGRPSELTVPASSEAGVSRSSRSGTDGMRRGGPFSKEGMLTSGQEAVDFVKKLKEKREMKLYI